MRVFLAIETTCDETAVSVIEGNFIKENLVYSQIKLHSVYKGVVPEVASRAHSEKISFLIGRVLKKLKSADAVVFSRGPGLLGPLIIGYVTARTISKYFNIPCIGVNHLEGHLLSCEIEDRKIKKRLKFPLISLIVSGGHTELWLVNDYGRYKLIGATRDDAAGEAFDKVAKLLGLGYPGGYEIEKLAKKAKSVKHSFPVPNVENSFDFSFSGLKTAVAYYLRDNPVSNLKEKAEIANAFQKAVIESLFHKTLLAVRKYKVKQVAICGGVSANQELRNYFVKNLPQVSVIFPEKKYCMDNAAMIGVCGLRRFECKSFVNKIEIAPDLEIESWKRAKI